MTLKYECLQTVLRFMHVNPLYIFRSLVHQTTQKQAEPSSRRLSSVQPEKNLPGHHRLNASLDPAALHITDVVEEDLAVLPLAFLSLKCSIFKVPYTHIHEHTHTHTVSAARSSANRIKAVSAFVDRRIRA